MDELTTFLIIAIISVGIGVALGSLFTNVNNARNKETKSGKAKGPVGSEAARIYRDSQSGMLVLEMKGKKYRKPEDLDAAGRAFFEQELATLLAWIKPAGQAQATTSAASESDPGEPDLSSRLASVLSDQEPATGSSYKPASDKYPAEEKPKQSYNPLDVITRALQSDVRKPGTPNASIAAQVDEILQEKLAGLPDEKRAIRLMELPGKGMVVMVGLDQYDGVDKVPDPDVRALIKECVAEWEQRMDRQE